jgi:N-methylhydantoinase A
LPRRADQPLPTSWRKVFFYRSGFQESPVYRSADLGPGMSIAGPAIIERPDTTVVVGVDQTLEIEPFGNMVLHLDTKGAR